MNKKLINKTKNGSIWLIGTNVLSVLLRIGSIAILARILEPRDFGTFALLKLIYLVPSSVLSAHITRNIILLQNKKGIFINSIYIAVLYSIIISIILHVFSSHLSLLFGDNSLEEYIKSLLYLPFLLMLNEVLNSYYSKELKFKAIAFRNFIAMTFGSVFISIYLSYLGYGIWALIYGFVVSEFLKFIFLIINIKIDTYSFNLNRIKLLYNNITFITSTQLLYQAVNNIDKTIISKYFGSTALGFYVKGAQTAQLPINLIANPLQKVGFASFATQKNNLPFLSNSMLSLLDITIKLLLPLVLLIFSMAGIIINILLGDNWTDSIIILQIMSFCMFFRFIFKIFTTFLATQERFDKIFSVQLVNLIVFLSCSYLLSRFGINGIAISLVIGVIVSCLLSFYILHKLFNISLKNVFHKFNKTFIISIVLTLLIILIELIFRDLIFFKWGLQLTFIIPYLCVNFINVKRKTKLN